MIGIARHRSQSPDVVLLDEPTSVVTQSWSVTFLDVMKQLAQEGDYGCRNP